MKKIIYTMIIACTTLFASCDSWLEVKPYDQIAEGELQKSDENTLTCESINIGYEFPLNIAKKFGMQALSIQANMNDIFRCSTVKAERGIDYPFARTVSFSIGATF